MPGLLKYCHLLFNITDIDFVGGAASDCTEVFTNISHIAFPSTKKLQCHVHIEQKFWKDKGNGGYLHYAIDKSYFYNTCRIGENKLHHCLSQEQFDAYAKLVKEAQRAIVKDGKIKYGLFFVFFANYINNPAFVQWFVNCGGVCGYDPTSQPTERAMDMMKGTKKYKGLMSIGHDVGTMIQVEFPKFIVNVSKTSIGVKNMTSLQEEDIIPDTNSNDYKDLALYYNSITESIDTSSNYDDGKIEHLINPEEFVGMFVDNDRVTKYYDVLNGVTNETFTSWQKICDCVLSLCLVCGTTVDNKVVYTSSCVQYCKTRFCNHSADYQYKHKLESYTVLIPTHCTFRSEVRRKYYRKSLPKRLLTSRLIYIAIKLDGLKTLCFKKACLYQIITKGISTLPCVTFILIDLGDKNNQYCSKRVEDANGCEMMITNLNEHLRKWKANDQEQQDVQNIVKD